METPGDRADTTFTLPNDGEAVAEDLVSLVWWWTDPRSHSAEGRPRSREQLHGLLLAAFQASLQYEEGRPVRFRLVFHPSPKQLTIPFSSPIEYSPSQLRQLAPTIGLGFRSLVVAPVDPSTDGLKILGICDPQLSPRPDVLVNKRWSHPLLGGPDLIGLTVSVMGPGDIRVTGGLWSSQLQHGTIRLPVAHGQVGSVNEWLEDAGIHLQVGWGIAGQLVRRTWTSILKKVSDARHGGCLLIVPDDIDAANLARHVNIKYPLDSDRLRKALEARLRAEPQLCAHVRGEADIDPLLLEDAPFVDRDLARTADLIASFASVDGAVILRRHLQIVGFAAEIVSVHCPSAPEMVDFGVQPGVHRTEPNIRPLSSFGMRHRSAIRFCQSVPGSMAFVVSQDGGVRVFFVRDGAIQGRDVIAEDWVIVPY